MENAKRTSPATGRFGEHSLSSLYRSPLTFVFASPNLLQKDEQPWIVHIEPDDLDDNGRKKHKRKRPAVLKKNPLTAKKDDCSSLQLPMFPTIRSDSEEWLLLDAITGSLEHTKMRSSKVALDVPEDILLDAKAVSPTADMLQFPEPPTFEIDFN